MPKNRSVPVDIILPHLTYPDVAEAVDWLTRVLGFREHYRYGSDPVEGAQMCLGDAWIMLSRPREGRGGQCLTIFMEDVDGHCARSRAAGAKIVEEPHETVYGEYQYAVEDPGGHRWLFSRHARDLSPEDWGAKIAG